MCNAYQSLYLISNLLNVHNNNNNGSSHVFSHNLLYSCGSLNIIVGIKYKLFAVLNALCDLDTMMYLRFRK